MLFFTFTAWELRALTLPACILLWSVIPDQRGYTKHRGVCLSRLAESTPSTNTQFLTWTNSMMLKAWSMSTCFLYGESVGDIHVKGDFVCLHWTVWGKHMLMLKFHCILLWACLGSVQLHMWKINKTTQAHVCYSSGQLVSGPLFIFF